KWNKKQEYSGGRFVMNKLRLSCNECQQTFSIPELKIDSIKIQSSSIERHYFKCPNCDQQYTAYYLNDDMKRLQKKIRVLKNKPTLNIKQRNQLLKLTRKLTSM